MGGIDNDSIEIDEEDIGIASYGKQPHQNDYDDVMGGIDMEGDEDDDWFDGEGSDK